MARFVRCILSSQAGVAIPILLASQRGATKDQASRPVDPSPTRPPPPSASFDLLASSPNLRNLPLSPSAIHHAKISIIHPQLRDLVLPLEKGRILYPRGKDVEELSWATGQDPDEQDLEGVGGNGWEKIPEPTKVRTILRLGFTPNCLVANKSIIACGGQHGELHISNLPAALSPSASTTLNRRLEKFQAPPSKPFTINVTLPTRSINNSMLLLPSYPTEWAKRERQRRIGFVGCQEEENEHISSLREEQTSRDLEEIEEDAMDLDEEEMEEPLSPATYPNTVPFFHAPRIPNLPAPDHSSSHAGPSRRSSSFSTERMIRNSPSRGTRLERQSFSIVRPGQPPIEYVTSRPLVTPPRSTISIPTLRRTSSARGRTGALRTFQKEPDEPRLLISNNDQTVKMFSLRTVPHDARPARPPPIAQPALPPPPPRFGSGFGWDSIAMREGMSYLHDSEVELLRRQREDLERIVGSHPGPQADKDAVEKKLMKVGGSRFRYAINHSSLSPDLKTMVSVGDSTDVYLFEVLEGGREFRKIATYRAATDSGFSTAWSSDGRKFATASQDGQVTVWDHRSSKPLATFFTSPSSSRELLSPSPSFTSDILASHSINSSHSSSPGHSRSSGWMLVDPVTGDARFGGSTSGREAARVVKFSPEGASRDLLVFSEENSNIHIVDAQNLDTHVVLPVPHLLPSETPTTDETSRRSRGVELGTWGIAGVAFDPSGDWLYAGTEGTVVEWDMRGGRAGGGTWGMV